MSPPTAKPGTVVALRGTLDWRFWLVAAIGTGATLLVLGIPTAVVPNPFFVRMTQTEVANVVVWLVSAPLIGLLAASYVRPPVHVDAHDATQNGAGRTTVGGIAAYLAIGCPICNKIVVAALGVSGAMEFFAPVQPIIGAGSVALLAVTLAWRLRERAKGCDRCAT